MTILITDDMLKKSAAEIDYAINAMYPDDGVYDHVFSERYERNIRKVFRMLRFRKFTRRATKRVACFIIALLTAATMVLTFNAEARAAFAGWVREQFGEMYHYFFVGEDEVAKANEYGEYTLDWVPEGYAYLDIIEDAHGRTVFFVNDAGSIIQFVCVEGSDHGSLFVCDGEYKNKCLILNDRYAEIYLAMDPGKTNGIAWAGNKENVMFLITGFVKESELIKMAQSLAQ